MTPEKQRIAIAKLCGWSVSKCTCPEPAGTHKATNRSGHLPDYPNDLNAMHEAEKSLTTEDERYNYAKHLEILTHVERPRFGECMMMRMITSTAAQRAEAFLKTMNKWET